MINLELLVREKHDQLNENDLQIWNYITQHEKECCDIRIEQLAEICHVSRTSILRFTKKISLSGFTELKFMLKQNVENQHQLSGIDIDEMSNIHNQSVSIIKEYDFTKACEILSSANHVFAYGIGELFSGAMQMMKSNFFLMNCMINPIQGIGEMKFVVNHICEADVVILFTMSGRNQTMIEFVKQLKEKSCKVITICGNRYGDIKEYSDLFFTFTPIPQKIKIDRDEYIPNSLLFYFIELFFFHYTAYIQQHE